uniref:Uncharacterized protein n=1 Tax=Anguilla anguilla TaxID=7936 RepID=A0A0E9T1R6_ANGAN
MLSVTHCEGGPGVHHPRQCPVEQGSPCQTAITHTCH